MHPLLIRQLAADFCCTPEEVTDAQHHFTVFTPNPERRQYQEIVPCILKIAVANGKLLFTGRADVIARCRELYANANAPWFMEATNLAGLDRELAAFGARISGARPFFTPDQLIPAEAEGYTILRYRGDEIEQFRNDSRFGNAYGFCETAPDMLGVGAMKDGQLLGMAGVSADSPLLWQIGIDVLPEARGQGIAGMLVRLLRDDVLAEGKLPYYGTSTAHLASQRVALGSGFRPAWFELVAAPLEK